MTWRNLVGLCAALLLTLRAAGAEPLPCPDPRFMVEAPDQTRHAQVCAMASDSAALIEACGLSLARPILVQIVENVDHAFADCLAAFDCDADRIRVTDPARYPERLPEGSAYAALPPDILLSALLTHELAHAMVEHATPDRQVAPVDHEYIAAVMELGALPADWRQVLLDHAAITQMRPRLIDIWIYRLEPRRFAANAWLHFSEPANGCTLVERIVSGEASFATDGG